jgi:hypothetical protein
LCPSNIKFIFDYCFYDGDVLSYDPGSLIMEWKSEFDLDKTPPKLEKFKFWKNRSEVGEGTYLL